MSVYNQQLFTESVSAVTATNTVELGTRRWHDGLEYCYVYNGGGTAAVKTVVILSGVTGYTVAVTYASGAAICPTPFGVVRNAELTAAYYGWVVTKGFTDVYNDGTASVAAGDFLVLSLNGYVRQYSAACVATALLYNAHHSMISAMQATDTAGTIGAYVRLG
jgi:hypothetical protein